MATKTARLIDRRPALLLLVLLWLACCLFMLWQAGDGLRHMAFHDPDDAMRLQQVRDLIAGQGWFDVSQHRVNPPVGGPMHWSRIVDMPIAAIILLTRPLLGAASAEWLACVAVPLLLLLALCLALHRFARHVAGEGPALLAVGLLVTAPSILIQFTPLRIDHHGWQILMAALALCGLFDRAPRRGGIVAGLAMATWLQISSEGLPYAAMMAGLLVLAHLARPQEGPRLHGYAGTLAAASLVLLLCGRGWSAGLHSHCDSLSPVYLLPLIAFALALFAGRMVVPVPGLIARLAVPAVGGALACLVFLSIGRQCLAGPFETLDPLAYRLWYLQVLEGRPVWEQALPLRGVLILPSLIGLVATLAAIRAAPDRDARDRWIAMTLLLAGATLISVMVMRAMTVAHLFALPGIAWMLMMLTARIQRFACAPARVVAMVLLVLLTPVGIASLWIALVSPPLKAEAPKPDCTAAASIAPLAALPRGVMLAPLDIGPAILIGTPHSVVGTAHHRNAAGISTVIRVFTAPPERARAAMAGVNGRHGPDYLLVCPGLNELGGYAKAEPKGLAATLAKGDVPSWLVPVPVKGPVRVYRIARQVVRP
ncbi:hypothetical protein PX699_09720 [Sphingobium sp. H39-3-25]|uniref:hypothetical protein n=1 Tax=Sphingobium arseniciresistens TaxID=3030834 RepID=UPI0023B95D70|nr:hypothetical protein [Sphingobium arseniciresistens]